MNLWLLVVLTIAALPPHVLSIDKQLKDSILASYKNQSQMLASYKNLEKTIDINKDNICLKYKDHAPELSTKKSTLIDIKSEIEYGDFNGTTGHYLIVDELTTIDIPAILKCTPKYKNGDPVLHCGKQIVYYFILFFFENVMQLRRSFNSQHIKENRSTYIILDAMSIEYYMLTYNNNDTARDTLEQWSKNKENTGMKVCKDLAPTGEVSEGSVAKWKIINGEIKSGTYILHLTQNITVEIPIIIECRVKVQDSINKIRNPKTVRKYFTIAKAEYESFTFGYIIGPKITNNKTIHFSINLNLLGTIEENQSA